MQKNRNSKFGFFNPRIFAAFLLCSMGTWLAMFSFAAPTSSTTDTFTPVVITSVVNRISPAVRDLPKVAPTGASEIGDNLPPIRPNHPVPAGFVDSALQTVPAALAAPTPMANFEGQGSVDSGGSAAGCTCAPPDTNGAVGPNQYVQMVNSVVSVYDKAGTRLSGPTPINALW